MRNKLTFLLLFTATLLCAQPGKIKLNAVKSEFEIISKTQTSLKFVNSISSLKTFQVKVNDMIFTQLQIDGYVGNKDNGYPQLPVYNKLIEIPYDAEIKVSIVSYDEETINLSDYNIYNKILPAQPSLSKSDKPENVPFLCNEEYYRYDDFNNTEIADISTLGIMRGVQIGRLSIHPIRYNPVKNILKVYNNLIVEIEFRHANLVKTNAIKQQYFSPFFNSSLKKLANYTPCDQKDIITQYPIKYVIVSHPMFQATLQPFIQWKTQKGFQVIEAYTDNPSVGNTTSSIKNYLQNLYNTGTAQDPAPTFILFVGALAQMPSFSGLAGTHVTDLYYCEYDGTGDYFPDAYYGRFSATSIAELQPQIDKTLEYEQYLMPDPSFLNEVVMIAGVDAGFAPIHGNGQINYGTSMYFNAAHGLLSHTYLYPGTENSAVAGQIINDVAKGVGFVNYTAHGGPDGWSDPGFSIADVATLINAHKYPLMIGNCCLTNKFDEPICFGEALLRAVNKGALGYIGGSNSSYWDEDYWWGTGAKAVVVNPVYETTKLGAYDCMFHENLEPDTKWFVTNSQMMHSGNLAVAEGGGSIQYYWEIYHLMGDPSVMTYFSVPPALTISYNNALPLGLTSLDITTEPYAYVAISQNNVLLDAQLAGSSGIVHLTFPAFAMPGTADIVATKQNRQPYIGTLSVIPNATAYIAYFSHMIDDNAENNNHQAEYSENANLDVTLKNIGLFDAQAVTTILSTLDTNIVINDNTELYGDMTSGQSVSKNAAYSISVKNNIIDLHNVLFTITATDNNSNSWTSNLSITLNAPKLKVISYSVNDIQGNDNGKLDPGEHVSISVVVNNFGHSTTPLTIGTLSTSNINIAINNFTFTMSNINPTDVDTAIFDLNVSPGTPLASHADFVFSADALPYSCQKLFTLPIGAILEDWECNTLTHYSWINSTSAPWVLVTDTTYEGTYALKSGQIDNSQTSDLVISINVLESDSISFFRKVSSENSYDFLNFYIDGIKAEGWSGQQDWTRVSFPVSAGSHALKWSYDKDYSVFEGSDCAWIDFISFPVMDIQTEIESILKNNYFSVYPSLVSAQTTAFYTLSTNADVSLILINTLGQTIETIVHTSQKSGNYEVPVTLKNMQDGIYFLRLQINGYTQTKRIIIAK